MPKKMKITISFEDKSGKMVTKPIEVEKEVPWIKEFDELGFEESFEKLEEAVLEGRKAATEKAAEEYLKTISKKKQTKNQVKKRK
jgi:hypothetical protein